MDAPVFLLKYGYWLTFGAVFAEQLGLPVPAVPILVSMGAFSRSGEFSILFVWLTALAASVTADMIWYNLGRHYGRSVLRLVCRISIEPDSCVRRTEDAFARRGLWALLLTKFVPGLNAAAVPMAGMIKIPLLKFLTFDLAGLTLWAGLYTTLGYVLSDQVERLTWYLLRFGNSALIALVCLLTAYVSYKLVQRRNFIRNIDAKRITAEELKSKLDERQDILVFDLRNPLEVTTERVRIPGALHILPEALGLASDDFPRDKEVVLYCTCPNDATSARAATKLRQMGIARVSALAGGLDAWRARNFPTESL